MERARGYSSPWDEDDGDSDGNGSDGEHGHDLPTHTSPDDVNPMVHSRSVPLPDESTIDHSLHNASLEDTSSVADAPTLPPQPPKLSPESVDESDDLDDFGDFDEAEQEAGEEDALPVPTNQAVASAPPSKFVSDHIVCHMLNHVVSQRQT